MSKYNKDVVKVIVDGIVDLKGRVNACEEAGLHYDTFARWMRGELPKEEFEGLSEKDANKKRWEFKKAVLKAERKARQRGKERAVMSIFKAMSEHWQAGAWWLERNFPGEFKERIETDNKDNAVDRIVRAIHDGKNDDSGSEDSKG